MSELSVGKLTMSELIDECQQQAETIRQLEQQLREREARVAVLENAINIVLDDENTYRARETGAGVVLLESLIMEPQQSLAAISEHITLDRPAKIGHMKFGKGVPWRLVVECAQRQFAQADKG